jgi:geranylgeranyl reductase family protein
MIDVEAIVVGGGPAGSTCAWRLNRSGIHTIIIDKKRFPRLKVCAGWITPRTIKNLQMTREEYPHSFLTFNRLNFHFFGARFPVRTRQYSIRRYEFDDWLLKRADVDVQQHAVKHIRKADGCYIIDDTFRCKYIVGAGGTNCPVYRAFFRKTNPRNRKRLIAAIEEEFRYDYQDRDCQMWFFDRKFPGYSWYVPKGNGYLNVGIGGSFSTMKRRGETVRTHWNHFIKKLEDLSLVKGRLFDPRGHNYYLRQAVKTGRRDNALICGDAAGLATIDMGEGIGPAVESGIIAGEAIIKGTTCSFKSVTRYSFFNILFPFLRKAHYESIQDTSYCSWNKGV